MAIYPEKGKYYIPVEPGMPCPTCIEDSRLLEKIRGAVMYSCSDCGGLMYNRQGAYRWLFGGENSKQEKPPCSMPTSSPGSPPSSPPTP